MAGSRAEGKVTLLRGLHRPSTAPRSERRPGRKVRPGACAGSGGSFREGAGREAPEPPGVRRGGGWEERSRNSRRPYREWKGSKREKLSGGQVEFATGNLKVRAPGEAHHAEDGRSGPESGKQKPRDLQRR